MDEKSPLLVQERNPIQAQMSNSSKECALAPRNEPKQSDHKVNGVVGIICLSMTLYTCSVAIYSLALTQYCYSYFSNYLFPNATDMSESNGSCNVDTESENYKERLKVQQVSTTLFFYSSFIDKGPGIIVGFFFGSLSDRYGRKVLLNIVLTGAIIQGLSYVLMIYFDVYAYYLLIATFIGSVSGGFYGAIALGFAYLSDITLVGKQRTIVIVFMEIAIGLGATLSGFVSGYLIAYLGYMYTVVLAVGLIFLSLFSVNVFLQESRTREIRHSTSVTDNLSSIFKFFTRDTSPTSKRWKYIVCMSVFAFASFGILSKSNIDVLYQLNSPFCWSSVWIGYFSAATNLFRGLLGGFMMKLFQACTTVSEKNIAVLSCFSNIGSSVLQAIAYTDIMLFLVPVVGTLSALVIPIMRSTMSGMTPPDKQGALFSSIAVTEMSAVLACDSSSKAVYKATVDTYRGTVYFIFGGYSVVALVLLLIFIVSSNSLNSPKPINIEKSISVTKTSES